MLVYLCIVHPKCKITTAIGQWETYRTVFKTAYGYKTEIPTELQGACVTHEVDVIAEKDGKVVGSVSGYIPPQEPDTFFLWQVAADSSARGTGLGTAMIHFILTSAACKPVRFLNTTITEDNEASWGLFKGIAKKLGAELNSEVMFDKERHFTGEHDSEMLVRIGPFSLN